MGRQFRVSTDRLRRAANEFSGESREVTRVIREVREVSAVLRGMSGMKGVRAALDVICSAMNAESSALTRESDALYRIAQNYDSKETDITARGDRSRSRYRVNAGILRGQVIIDIGPMLGPPAGQTTPVIDIKLPSAEELRRIIETTLR